MVKSSEDLFFTIYYHSKYLSPTPQISSSGKLQITSLLKLHNAHWYRGYHFTLTLGLIKNYKLKLSDLFEHDRNKIIELLKLYINYFSPKDTSMSLIYLGKIGFNWPYKQPDFSSKLFETISNSVAKFNCQGISNAILGLAQIGLKRHDLPTPLIYILLQKLNDLLPTFNAQDVANTLIGCNQMGFSFKSFHSAIGNNSLKVKFISAFGRTLPYCSHQNLANALPSLNQMGINAKELKNQYYLIFSAIERINAVTIKNEQFVAQDIASILFSFSLMGLSLKNDIPFSTKQILFANLQKLFSKMNPQNIAHTLIAFKNFGLYWWNLSRQMQQGLLQTSARNLTDNKCSCKNISSTVFALHYLGQTYQQLPYFYSSLLLQEIVKRIFYFNTQEITHLTMSLAKMNFPWHSFHSNFQEVFMSAWSENMVLADKQTLTKLILGLSYFNISKSDLSKNLLEQLTIALTSSFKHLNLKNIENILTATCHMNFNFADFSPVLKEKINETISEKIESFPATNLNNVFFTLQQMEFPWQELSNDHLLFINFMRAIARNFYSQEINPQTIKSLLVGLEKIGQSKQAMDSDLKNSIQFTLYKNLHKFKPSELVYSLNSLDKMGFEYSDINLNEHLNLQYILPDFLQKNLLLYQHNERSVLLLTLARMKYPYKQFLQQLYYSISTDMLNDMSLNQFIQAEYFLQYFKLLPLGQIFTHNLKKPYTFSHPSPWKQEVVSWVRNKYSDLNFISEAQVGPFVVSLLSEELQLIVQLNGPSHFARTHNNKAIRKAIDEKKISLLTALEYDVVNIDYFDWPSKSLGSGNQKSLLHFKLGPFIKKARGSFSNLSSNYSNLEYKPNNAHQHQQKQRITCLLNI